jgi:hypothetical protein
MSTSKAQQQTTQQGGEKKEPQPTDMRQSKEFREQKREQAEHQPRDDQGKFISKEQQKK